MIAFDLTDVMNPVVVKEVRQGLKSKRFMAVFLILLVCMTAGIAVALLPERVSEVREITTGVFWSIASTCFLLLMPLLGVNALSAEKKQKTFELVMLTRVTAWRLVLGKWTSLVAQTLLVASTLLPYLVLRHYVGGIELTKELLLLFGMLLCSCSMSAFAVFISSFESWLVKLGLIGAQLWAMGALAAVGVQELTRGGSTVPTSTHGWELLAGIGGLALLVVFVLEVAASRLAPISENHAIRKRGLAIFVVLGAACLTPFDIEPVSSTFACMFLFAAALDACVERFAPTPTVYAPFVRYGAFGRAAGFLFYPGPVSATFFVALTSVVITAFWGVSFDFNLGETLLLVVTMSCALLVPLALARALTSLVDRPAIVIVAFYAAMGLIAAVGQAAVEVLHDRGSVRIPAILPVSSMFAALAKEIRGDEFTYAIVVNGLLAVMAMVYLVFGRREDWQMVADQEKRAALLNARRRSA